MSKYTVIVGNIGIVIDTDDYQDAIDTYEEYCNQSDEGYGRAAHELVELIDNETGDAILSNMKYTQD